jgi:hypothetical protein
MSDDRKKHFIMNRRIYAIISLLIILTFIGYIIYDSINSGRAVSTPENTEKITAPPAMWEIEKELEITYGKLQSVAVSDNSAVYLGGDSFLSCYDSALNSVWRIQMPDKINAVSVYGDTVYAASQEMIYLVTDSGQIISEWGPYESNSIITSISASGKNIGFADSGNKRIFILNKKGEVISMAGQSENKFIIPSPYFDVALSGDGIFYAANTGHRRIETWTTDGIKKDEFGEPGTAPGAFCGCCNPAHFTVIPQGFLTAEKGINRIKILDHNGTFVEFVSSINNFTASVPLDIASNDGVTIYAADPADSRLIVFKRKNDMVDL